MINNENMLLELKEVLERDAQFKNRTLFKPNRFHVSVQLKELFNKNARLFSSIGLQANTRTCLSAIRLRLYSA